MKKNVLTGILVVFLFCIVILFYEIGKSQTPFVLSLYCLGVILLFEGMSFLYQRFLNKYPLQKKHFIAFYLIYTLLNFSIYFLSIESFSICSFISFILQLLAGYFFTLFIRREYDKSLWAFSFLLLLLIPFFQMGSWNFSFSLVFLISSFTLFLTTLFDEIAIYRKKNYCFMILMGAILGIIFPSYSSSWLYLIFLMFIVSRKRGIKSAIKLSSLMFLSYIFVAIFQWHYDISYFNLFPTHFVFSTFFSFFFLFCFLIGTIYCIYKPERKMGFCCRGILLILFGICLFQPTSLIYEIGLFLPVYLLLLLSLFDHIPLFYKPIISTYKISSRPQSIVGEKVSVVVPNYNYENFLVERIDSILRQSYQIYELIILDDCSKDNSIEVITNKIEEIKEKYPDISVKFIPNKKNSGNVFKQWAKCFEVASGDYLWICEADDSASPKFLNQVMKAFHHDNIVLAYTESLTINEHNELLMPNLREWIDIFETGKWNQSYIATGKEELENTLCINNTIANVSSVVFRLKKDIPFLTYLKEAQAFHLSGDWYFYAKVLGHGSISYCKKSLNFHRMHSKSVTLTTKGDLNYQEVCKIQDMIQNEYQITELAKERIFNYQLMLRRRFGLGNVELALLEKPFEPILKKSKVKDEILLSIIIAVYNTELYLRKCLDSVLINIPPKTEIIIINDGSPDNSQKIILEYQKKYKDIVFGFQKENGGLSSAKNFGLKKARGRYVIFLDSDDFVAPNMYMTLLKKGLMEDADVVYCDMYELFDPSEKVYFGMQNWEREDEILGLIDTPLMATSCNKICKKSLFHGLSFPEGLVNEDVAVTPILISRAEKICYVDSPFYYYLQREGSIQNSEFQDKRFAIFETAKLCFQVLEKEHSTYLNEIKGSIYTHQILGILLFIFPRLRKKERMRFLKIFCEKIKEFEDFFTNSYVLQYVELYHLPKLLLLIRDSSITKLDIYLQIKMR